VLTFYYSFMPETLRSLVGDGSLPPPKLNSSPQQLWTARQAAKAGFEEEQVERPPLKKVCLDWHHPGLGGC
jgi:hypothetical protein